MREDRKLVHEELSRRIVGAAMRVINELRPGLDEKLYENVLVIELELEGLSVQQQSRFPVHFRDRLIGTLVPDLIVENAVVVDPKVASAFNDEHVAQCWAIFPSPNSTSPYS